MSLSKLEAIGHVPVNPMRETVAQPPPPHPLPVVKGMPATVNSDSPAVDDAALRLRGQFMPAAPPLVSTVIDERRHPDATLEVSSSTSSVQCPESTLNPLRVRSSRINSNSHRAGPTVRALSNIAREYTAAVTSMDEEASVHSNVLYSRHSIADSVDGAPRSQHFDTLSTE